MGYKIIVSTHFLVFLEFAWAFYILKKNSEEAFRGIFDKNIDTVYFSREEGQVFSKDITSLDVASEDDAIAKWGGLSQFSGKVTDIVSRYLNVM